MGCDKLLGRGREGGGGGGGGNKDMISSRLSREGGERRLDETLEMVYFPH